MKMRAKITRIVSSVLLIALLGTTIVFAAFAVITRVNNKDKPIFLFGISILEVLTDSMRPEINQHDVIFIKNVPPESLSIGDIITFKFGAVLNTHKIISIDSENRFFTTKGTNASGQDEPVSFDDVYGKVIYHSAAIGSFVLFLKSPMGFFFLIIIPVLGLVLYETVNVKKKLDVYKQKAADPSFKKITGIKKEIEDLEKHLSALGLPVTKDLRGPSDPGGKN